MSVKLLLNAQIWESTALGCCVVKITIILQITQEEQAELEYGPRIEARGVPTEVFTFITTSKP